MLKKFVAWFTSFLPPCQAKEKNFDLVLMLTAIVLSIPTLLRLDPEPATSLVSLLPEWAEYLLVTVSLASVLCMLIGILTQRFLIIASGVRTLGALFTLHGLALFVWVETPPFTSTVWFIWYTGVGILALVRAHEISEGVRLSDSLSATTQHHAQPDES